MPGFVINNQGWNIVASDYYDSRMVKGSMRCGNYHIARSVIPKFADDKVFSQNDEFAVAMDGVTLNRLSVMQAECTDSFFNAIVSAYKKDKELFPRRLRGAFSCALYDKKEDEWTVWTNQTAECSVFYYFQNGIALIASAPNYILDALREHGIECTLDEQAVYSMLTYAFMYDERTYANEIKRLLPGEYVKFNGSTLSIDKYYGIPWGKYDLTDWSEEQVIDELDKRFTAAVKLEYDKDLEYGYRHFADLSGGLDCRTSAWVAVEQRYTDIVNLHYSQSGSNEEEITKQISETLGTELMYYSLNSHRFLFDADKLVKMNYGLQLFTGITGGQRMLESISTDIYGLEHTGMIGDVVIGSCLKPGVDYSTAGVYGAYSTRLAERLDAKHLEKYAGGGTEKQFIEVRGLLGALSSAFIRRNYTEIASPFMDIDVMEFCFSIPYEKRMDHKLYKKWLIRCHPQAATIRWSTDDTKITDGKISAILRRLYYHGPKKAARIIGLRKYGEKQGMNPFEYWYRTDSSIEEQWKEKLTGLSSSDYPREITESIETLWTNGNVLEKSQAVSAAVALRYWFPAGTME